MRACVQRVARASVTVGDELSGQIDRGVLVLLGVADGDLEGDARGLAAKIVSLRIFEDEAGKINRSLADTGGAMLVVSQFTLLGDCRRGRRPSFTAAAAPELARRLYAEFVAAVRHNGIQVETGRFRQHMLVESVNDGPVTMLLDSSRLF